MTVACTTCSAYNNFVGGWSAGAVYSTEDVGRISEKSSNVKKEKATGKKKFFLYYKKKKKGKFILIECSSENAS